MRTNPKSSVDILEHVTNGGVHVETRQAVAGKHRSFESIVALVETETFSTMAPTRNLSAPSNVLSKNGTASGED